MQDGLGLGLPLPKGQIAQTMSPLMQIGQLGQPNFQGVQTRLPVVSNDWKYNIK
jgi:hypothetical protein